MQLTGLQQTQTSPPENMASYSGEDITEQEEALIALIEHRAKEVDHLRTRVTYYKSQVLLLTLFDYLFSRVMLE